MAYFKRYFLTIKDIGLKRLLRRIRYELRIKIDHKIPKYISHVLIGYDKKEYLNWKKTENFSIKNNNFQFQKNFKKDEIIDFKFCNKLIKLGPYFIWNDKYWDRLWQFNLHYFDWARESLDLYIEKKIINNKLFKIKLLILHWINLNKIGRGDGWHSYTTSLRIRNWIWVVRLFPKLQSREILSSIWEQLCWLVHHLEDANGGNHYLENLCSLIVGSLQFESQQAKKLYDFAISKLEIELQNQILKDGGHEERSASYHILVLDRLVEVGIIIKIMNNSIPIWLINKIKAMLDWTLLIRLQKGNFPRFNDSPFNGCPNIDISIAFAESFLNSKSKKRNNLKGIRKILIEKMGDNFNTTNSTNKESIIKLNQTGWTLIKPGKGWEIIFKAGESCPKHLYGHAHSDLFTFDIYKNGIPFISEAGTSTYEKNQLREYERSGSAHNVFEIIKIKKEHKSLSSKVFEPIDVWSSFRAGRKANILDRDSGYDNGIYWVRASHDGYKHLNLKYSREITFELSKKDSLIIKIKDTILSKNKLNWRVWIHFSPFIKKIWFNKLIKETSLNNKDIFKIVKTHYSYGFGKRKNRKSFCFYGNIEKGFNIINTKIILNNLMK